MKLLVLCLGNDLLGDDGIGLEAAELIEEVLGPVAEVRSACQSGLYLIEFLEGFDDAIVVDTFPGERPGRVRELDSKEVEPVQVPSAHYVGLPEALHAARNAGLHVPNRLRIFAIEIPIAQVIGSAPRREVKEALPEIVRRVSKAVREWGYG